MNFQGGNGLRFSCITALHSELLAVSTTGYLYQVGKRLEVDQKIQFFSGVGPIWHHSEVTT